MSASGDGAKGRGCDGSEKTSSAGRPTYLI